jgi:hypothetical protein
MELAIHEYRKHMLSHYLAMGYCRMAAECMADESAEDFEQEQLAAMADAAFQEDEENLRGYSWMRG